MPATTPAPATATTDTRPTDTRPTDTGLCTALWGVHYGLRVFTAFFLLVYGWVKVLLLQMGRADYGDALIQYGAMSPMGLLWKFVGYSAAFQFLSGLFEVTAAALLLWRRTVLPGALLGAFDMGFVLFLNLAYDVDVKFLSALLTVCCLTILAPFAGRTLGLLGSGPVTAGPVPRAVPWPRAHRLTRWVGAAVAVAMVAGSGTMALARIGTGNFRENPPPLAGVYRVVADTRPPAPQLAADTRWQQMAFGQWRTQSGAARVQIRSANGDLRSGTYTVRGQTVHLELQPVMRGAQPVNQPTELALDLQWARTPDGGLRLWGADQDVHLASDPETRFLFDREFSWTPRRPVNR